MKFTNIKCNLCGSSEFSKVAEGIDFEYKVTTDNFKMVKCNNCSLVFLNPRPALSELDTIYPKNYIPYRFDDYLSPFVQNLRMKVQKSKVKSLKKFIKMKKEETKIWDVGCGGGFFLECLRKFGNSNWELTGIDISRKAIEKIRANGFLAKLIRFETLQNINEEIDVIVLNQVIEHLDDPKAVIKKSYEILKKNGIIFIETPSLDGWDAKIFKSRYWGGWHFPRHWTLFTFETLKKMLEKEGFRVINKQYILSPNFWAQSLHHAAMEKKIPQWIVNLFDCKNPFILSFFSAVDLFQILFNHTSNMRVIAEKI